MKLWQANSLKEMAWGCGCDASLLCVATGVWLVKVFGECSPCKYSKAIIWIDNYIKENMKGGV